MGEPHCVPATPCSNCTAEDKGSYQCGQPEVGQPVIEIPAKRNDASEYQSAYRLWPWQPRLQALKPGQTSCPYQDETDLGRAKIGQRTTYRVDYNIPAQKFLSRAKNSSSEMNVDIHRTLNDMDSPRQRMKRMQKANAKVIHPHRDQPFNVATNYVYSYKNFDPSTIQDCRPAPIRGKDNLEVPATGDATSNTRSTAKDDYIVHENAERPVPILPVENHGRPTDPLEGATEYKDYYTAKVPIRVTRRKPVALVRNIDFSQDKFQAISTAMADFVTPKNPVRPTACIPPVSDHFSKEKFEASTTFQQNYKTWPVQKYEPPIWAMKPKYKRPDGGMISSSLYMHDFRNPEMILPPTPIKPEDRSRFVIINPEKDHIKLEDQTTYKADYHTWADAPPPESFRVIQMYTPPKEKMVCETNQRSSFKGERGDRRLPCRHISQHRDLHTDETMVFGTTYNTTYSNPRPHTTPAQQTQLRPLVRNMGPIPTPTSTPMAYAQLHRTQDQEPADKAANATTSEDRVDILKCDD